MARKSGVDRREDILDATIRLVSAKGLTGASTREVAAALGVGNGLINHYFKWSALRAEAFDRIVRADLDRTLRSRVLEPADIVAAALIDTAFDDANDFLWRVWIEGCEAAETDKVLASAVATVTDLWRSSLSDLMSRGEREGRWVCKDPNGAGWRLLALLDGLVGLLLIENSRLSRNDASAHLRVAFGYECSQRRSSSTRRGRRSGS